MCVRDVLKIVHHTTTLYRVMRDTDTQQHQRLRLLSKTATALLLMSSGIREMSHQVRQIAIARIGRHHQNLMSVAMTCNDYGEGRVEQVDDETS